MSTTDRLEIHKAFVEAMDKEDLHTRQAASFLNINPLYVTYIKNPKYHDTISVSAWDRFEEWFNTREAISAFTIPKGEAIVTVADASRPRTKKDTTAVSDYPSFGASPAEPEKQGKSVKLVLYKAEIDSLNKRIDLLVKDNNDKAVQIDNMATNLALMLDENTKLEQKCNRVAQELFTLKDETIAVMRQEIEDLQTGINHLVTLPKPDGKAQIVFFQRNTYKS